MPMVAHRRSKGIAIPILNISTRLGWVISSMPWLLYSQESGPFPTVNMSVWAWGWSRQVGERDNLSPHSGVQIRLSATHQVTTPSMLSPCQPYRGQCYVYGGFKESMAESYGDCHVAETWHRRLPKGALVTLQGWQMRNATLFHPRLSVHGEEPYPTRGDPVTQNTADLKE